MKEILAASALLLAFLLGCGSDSADSGQGDTNAGGSTSSADDDDGDGGSSGSEPDDTSAPDIVDDDDGDGGSSGSEPDDTSEPDDDKPDEMGEPDESSEPDEVSEPDDDELTEGDTGLRCNNNGIVEEELGEECDDGNRTNRDSCRNSCRWNVCGDGYWLREITDEDGPGEIEECDDGNDDGGYDGCHNTCETAYCGDGIVRANEQCEPGDTHPDDPRVVCLRGCVWDFPESEPDDSEPDPEPDAGEPDDTDASMGEPDASVGDAGIDAG